MVCQNTLVVSYINHQGDLRLRPLCNLAHCILLWAKGKLLSLRAVYIQGCLSQGADFLLKQKLRPVEWRLNPQVVELIWSKFNDPLSVLVPPYSSNPTATCNNNSAHIMFLRHCQMLKHSHSNHNNDATLNKV